MPQLMKEQVIFRCCATERNQLAATDQVVQKHAGDDSYTPTVTHREEGVIMFLPCWSKVQGWAVSVLVFLTPSAGHCSSHTIYLFHYQGNSHCPRLVILYQIPGNRLETPAIPSRSLGKWCLVIQRRIPVKRFLSLGTVCPWSWAWSQHPLGRGVCWSGWYLRRPFGTMCLGKWTQTWSGRCQASVKYYKKGRTFNNEAFHCRQCEMPWQEKHNMS